MFPACVQDLHQEPIHCVQVFLCRKHPAKGLPCLQNAFKSYVRTRDYCTTGKHVIQMCLNVIKVSIELGNYVHVNNYISKAEQTPEVQVRFSRLSSLTNTCRCYMSRAHSLCLQALHSFANTLTTRIAPTHQCAATLHSRCCGA